MCQLEGCDRGGRDSAAELAQAGGIDVNVGRLLQSADFGVSPRPDAENYTPLKSSVNDFVRAALTRFTSRDRMAKSLVFTVHLTLFRALPILQIPQSPLAR